VWNQYKTGRGFVVSEQKIIYKDKEYKIIAAEQEFIIHPAALGILPIAKASFTCNFSAEYFLDGYKLYLDRIKLLDDASEKEYVLKDCRLYYNGSILIAADLVNEFRVKGSNPACFSYQNVKELIFNDGVLVTGIDQNRAMHRIRKNLELGLRRISNSKDVRCINRFLDSAFVGDYRPFRLTYNRFRYIKKMKSCYDKVKPVYVMP